MDNIFIFNFVLNLLQIIMNIDNFEGGRFVSQEDIWPSAAVQFPVRRRGAWSRELLNTICVNTGACKLNHQHEAG
jgi:hypothetical protein